MGDLETKILKAENEALRQLLAVTYDFFNATAFFRLVRDGGATGDGLDAARAQMLREALRMEMALGNWQRTAHETNPARDADGIPPAIKFPSDFQIWRYIQRQVAKAKGNDNGAEQT